MKTLLQSFSPPNPESSRNVPYSFGPNSFVQPGVNANIRSTHFFHCKFTDFLEGSWCSLLEATRTSTRTIYWTSANCQHRTLIAAIVHQPRNSNNFKHHCQFAVSFLSCSKLISAISSITVLVPVWPQPYTYEENQMEFCSKSSQALLKSQQTSLNSNHTPIYTSPNSAMSTDPIIWLQHYF